MALLEFRSKAAGGFFMMPATFKEVCRVAKRSFSPSGCWPLEDLPGILQSLEVEVLEEKKRLQEQEKRYREQELAGRGYPDFEQQEAQKRREEFVSFGMRTMPLREMLRLAIAKEQSIMWGVP